MFTCVTCELLANVCVFGCMRDCKCNDSCSLAHGTEQLEQHPCVQARVIICVLGWDACMIACAIGS